MQDNIKLKDYFPTEKQWNDRRNYFSWAMGKALGNGRAGTSTRHARLLELELEAVFCVGAWYATIVLACAAVEVYVTEKADGVKATKFLDKFELREDWIWLSNKRNALVHPTKNSPDSSIDPSYEQPELEKDAKRAIVFALQVLLLGTRENIKGTFEFEPRID